MLLLSANSRTPDLVLSGWLINSCWLLACYGCAIFQMWLLAQGWQLLHAAWLPACLFALWIVGTLIGSQRRLVWAGLFAGMGLLVLLISTLPSLALLADRLWFPTPLLHGLLSGLLAVCGGAGSQIWLGQARPGWPQIGEYTRLNQQWTALTVGLAVVWWQQTAPWSLLLCGVLLLPLLTLECWPWSPLSRGSCPFLLRQSLQAQHPLTWHLVLETSDLPRGWLWSWLRRRQRLWLSLLMVGVNVVLALVCGSVLTPFAVDLRPASQLLVWLALSQVALLLLDRLMTETGLRGLLGKPFRTLPPGQRALAGKILLLLLVGLGSSLACFGSGLSVGWPIVAVFTAYTGCGTFWSQLVARLLPTCEMVARETPLAPSLWRLPWELPEQQASLAVERALERLVARRLEWLGTPFLLLGLPLCGWLIDQGGLHLLLPLLGPLLILGAIGCSLFSRQEQRAHPAPKAVQ